MASNRKAGNAFEREFCRYLAERGFWVHNFAQKTGGQPFDVIAARHWNTYVFDCKVCENDEFPFSRIEDNQRMAMHLWHNCDNHVGIFALKFSNGKIYLITLDRIEYLEQRCKSADEWLIQRYGTPLEKWVKTE